MLLGKLALNRLKAQNYFNVILVACNVLCGHKKNILIGENMSDLSALTKM